MKFIFCWVLMVVGWACIAGAMGVKALIGFALGALAVIGASLGAGLAAASAYDRREDGDGWQP